MAKKEKSKGSLPLRILGIILGVLVVLAVVVGVLVFSPISAPFLAWARSSGITNSVRDLVIKAANVLLIKPFHLPPTIGSRGPAISAFAYLMGLGLVVLALLVVIYIIAMVVHKQKQKKNGGNPIIASIRTLFILALVVALVAVILMISPASSIIKRYLKYLGEPALAIRNYVNAWVARHVCENFHVPTAIKGCGVSMTSCIYLVTLFLGLLALLYLLFLPFTIMAKNKAEHKTQNYRKVLCWIAFVEILGVLGCVALFLYKQRAAQMLGALFTTFTGLISKYVSLFQTGGLLEVIKLSFIAQNAYVSAALYACIAVVVVELILLFFARTGKPDAAAVAAAAEKEKVAVATTEATATIRDVALLNSLEAIIDKPVSDLPGVESELGENSIEELENNSAEAMVVTPADATLDNALDPHNSAVDVLPGIDEWDATPWDEEPVEEAPVENTVEETPVEEPAPVEEVVEEVVETPVEEVVEEPAPVEEVTEAAAPEAEEEVVVEEVVPVEEPTPVEEPAPVEEVVEEVPVEVVPAEEPAPVEEEPVEEGPVTVAINYLPNDGRRPQETEQDVEPTENTGSREEYKTTETHNEHEPVTEQHFCRENAWVIPAYVPEEKPVEEEPAPVEEKPAEEVAPKPVTPVKPIPVPPGHTGDGKPRGPIAPIKPVKKEEEPTEEVPEEKKRVIISAPLTDTSRAKHDKIETVEAKKVKFERKNYNVKTYEGDLTAEQAFAMGVTKVKPAIDPMLNTNKNEPAWKKRRREADLKKNGFDNVRIVSELDGKPTVTSSSGAPKGSSIRSMLKNAKAADANNAAAEQKSEENKMAKPAAPVAIKKPSAPIASNKPEPATEPNQPAPAKPAVPVAPVKPTPTSSTNKPKGPIAPIKPVKK